MKGRKPIPTKLKVLTGNPGKQKLPKGEPQPPEGIPQPPAFLDAYALEEWNRVVVGLSVMGCMASVDASSFGAYCVAYSRWRHAEEELNRLREKGEINALVIKTPAGNWTTQPLVRISRHAAEDVVKYASEFGLTPASRVRLAVDPGRGRPSKFEGLISIRGRSAENSTD